MNTLRIATFNCLNLALPGFQTYPGFAPYDPDEYIARIQWMATLLDRLAADLVLLQEVFHEKALSDVVRQTEHQGRDLRFLVPLASETNDRPRLGLLWRLPLAPEIDSIADIPGAPVPVPERAEHRRFSRPVLRARVPILGPAGSGLTLTVFNLHLKSRRPEFVDGEDERDPAVVARGQLRALVMRAAEAAGVRQLVAESVSGARSPVVVGGDFNDAPNAVTTRIVADTSWRPDDLPPPDPALFDVFDLEDRGAPGQVRAEPFTILHGGGPERIDHLLVSGAFVPHAPDAVGRIAAVEVFNDHLDERRRQARLGAAAPGSPDLSRIYSDHAAVCATVMFTG